MVCPITYTAKKIGPKLQKWFYTSCIHFWCFESPS